MKRMLSLVLVMVFLTGFAAMGFAESVDFSQLSNNALTTLYELLEQEMVSRGLLKSRSYNLPDGKYIIGQDILPGKYNLTCMGTSGETLGNVYSSLGGVFDSLSEDDGTDYGSFFGSLGGLMSDLVYTQVDIIGDYGIVIKSYQLKKDQTVQVLLEEKTAIQIQDGPCTLTPAE